MELEFDKEIDAMLRKARSGTSVAAVLDGPHLDADAIAAFVDNALPGKIKLLYTEHLADCGRCRGLLSQTVLMNETAASTPAGAAEVLGEATAGESWWSRAFRTPNLALAMGALVLTFSGVLGYLFVTNRTSESNVVQVSEKPAGHGPSAVDDDFSAPANAATQPGSASSNTSAAANIAANSVPASSPGIAESEKDASVSSRSVSNLPSGVSVDGLTMRPSTDCQECGSPADEPIVAAKPASAPPAPIRSGDDKEKVNEDSKLADSISTERKDDQDRVALAKKRSPDDYGGSRRDQPAKSTAGPSRASGNIQQQSQSNIYVEPTRSAGGKTFIYRNGAWYDSAYRGQGTREIKRGSDKYKALDAGLRNTVEQFSGTVWIVWSGKGYKIY